LITAGPTWVAIDKARVISNIASGETGFILANKLARRGVKVTLLSGPGYFHSGLGKVKLVRFKYFSELKDLLKKELNKKIYAAVIHSAAVSDYKPEKTIASKVRSGKKNWKIKLVATKKLIENLKDYSKNLFTVGFKFEPDAGDKTLIKSGKRLLKSCDLDLVVANSYNKENYRAYIIDDKKSRGPLISKARMADYLVEILRKKFR